MADNVQSPKIVLETLALERHQDALKRLDNNFQYHTPKSGQPEKYEQLRAAGKEYARMVLELCPDSRERSLALTDIESSNMWANASIARNE